MVYSDAGSIDPEGLDSCGGLLVFAVTATRGFPVMDQDFYSAVTVTVILNITGLSLIFRTRSSSDLSLSIPCSRSHRYY
ncbi:MAG: hypothetical protein M0Q91_09390 [Methanoregula sp.]|nr:hypothetical protein [Methanoregula sp.]